MDINALAQSCICDHKYRKSIYRKYIQSQDDFFFENYEGTIREDLLYACLQIACRNRHMSILVIEIMRFSDESSVSARVFESIKARRQNFRKNSIHVLAHCTLSTLQYLMLFSLSQEIELFDSILCTLINNPEFSIHDVQVFLELSKDIKAPTINLCDESTFDETINPLRITKMNIAKEYLFCQWKGQC